MIEKVRIGKDRTSIRIITPNDVDTLVDLAMREVPLLPHYQGVTMDRDRIKILLENQSKAKDESAFFIRVLVDKNDNILGGVAAYCVTMLISWEKMTNDIFLFVNEEWRTINNVMKLIDAYKTWADQRGAVIQGATHTGGYRSEAMARLLKIAGFSPVGTIYYRTKEGD